jgi:hypothetical protein
MAGALRTFQLKQATRCRGWADTHVRELEKHHEHDSGRFPVPASMATTTEICCGKPSNFVTCTFGFISIQGTSDSCDLGVNELNWLISASTI